MILHTVTPQPSETDLLAVLTGKGEGLRANQLQATTDWAFSVSDLCILTVQQVESEEKLAK